MDHYSDDEDPSLDEEKRNMLSKLTSVDLMEELNRRNQKEKELNNSVNGTYRAIVEEFGSPIGKWMITTEADGEGRSVAILCTNEEGHILDLIQKYGKKSMYKLTIHPGKEIPHLKPEHIKEVHIGLCSPSSTWNVSEEVRCHAIERWLKSKESVSGRKFTVGISNIYAGVKVIFP